MLRDINGLLALSAYLPGKPLGKDQVCGRGNEKRLYTHIKEPVYRSRGIVGVKGGKDHMAGQSGFNCDLGSLKVPDLSHHYYVRVLPEERPEGGCKV